MNIRRRRVDIRRGGGWTLGGGEWTLEGESGH